MASNGSAEHHRLIDEFAALRAELAELKHKLACCEQVRKENASYMQELWDDNRKLHSELAYFNRRELKKV